MLLILGGYPLKYLTCFLAMFLVCTSARCVNQETPVDPVSRVVQRYGVPRENVLAIAEELGVDPSDIGSFGNYYFPYNYYEYLFTEFEQEYGRPPKRSEIEQLVRGYVAKCNDGLYRIHYVYYSTETHPGFGEIAMVLTVHFQLPPPNQDPPADPVFFHLQPIELWDRSVNPPDSIYWDECIQEYAREK